VILVKAFMFCTFSFVEDYKMPRFPGHLRLNQGRLVGFVFFCSIADGVAGGFDIFTHAGNSIAGRQQGHCGHGDEDKFFHNRKFLVGSQYSISSFLLIRRNR